MCRDIFTPRSSRSASIDGAYFGTTFPHLFLMTFPELIPQHGVQSFVIRLRLKYCALVPLERHLLCPGPPCFWFPDSQGKSISHNCKFRVRCAQAPPEGISKVQTQLDKQLKGVNRESRNSTNLTDNHLALPRAHYHSFEVSGGPLGRPHFDFAATSRQGRARAP